MYRTAIRLGSGRWINSPPFLNTTQAEEWLLKQAILVHSAAQTAEYLEPWKEE